MKNLIALISLAACCLFSTTTFSQTTFTGANSTDWADAGNWDNGLPAPGNDATIPNGLTVSIESDVDFDFDVNNFGTIEHTYIGYGFITNYGTIENYGTINIGWYFWNINGSTINNNNGGTINITEVLGQINETELTVFAGATINNYIGGTIDNSGTIWTNGTIYNHSSINNFGKVQNHWNFYNQTGGTITVTNGGWVNNNGNFYNCWGTYTGCLPQVNPLIILDDCYVCGGNGTSGCTDPAASNYDFTACSDDGSCVFCDITSDNQEVYDEAFAAGVASVDITLDNQDAFDAGVASVICPEVDPCPMDLNNDNSIGTSDLLELLAAFGTACP